MSDIRKEPCTACPYRRDVPSGLWAEHEYDKLVEYDAPTSEQPMAVFACHATPDHLCHGWAVVGGRKVPNDRDLLALRMGPPREIPPESVPLFDSHTEAAEHGRQDIATPSLAADAAIERLQRKYPRLRPDAPRGQSTM